MHDQLSLSFSFLSYHEGIIQFERVCVTPRRHEPSTTEHFGRDVVRLDASADDRDILVLNDFAVVSYLGLQFDAALVTTDAQKAVAVAELEAMGIKVRGSV